MGRRRPRETALFPVRALASLARESSRSYRSRNFSKFSIAFFVFLAGDCKVSSAAASIYVLVCKQCSWLASAEYFADLVCEDGTRSGRRG